MENNTTSEGKRASKKSLSGFAWAFIALFVLFFAAGIGSLGSFRSTGKAFEYVAGSTNAAVFDLEMSPDQSSLKAVYINVGSIYAPIGKDTTITIKRTSTADHHPTTTFGSTTLGNIYSSKNAGAAGGKNGGKEGGNFNWVQVATDKNVQAKAISVSATNSLAVNEIICIGNDGKPIAISPNMELSQGFINQKKQLSNATDAQKSFIYSNSSRYNFTQEEAYYMTSIHTVLGGRSVVDGSVYNVDKDFNSLATVLLLPSVAIFGDSVGALRLTPFLATCATLILVYLLGSLLFKDEKYGFVFALIFALGGLATTVGRLGAPYALVACFLVAAVYFMYRFFAKGISSERIVKDGLNILFSGLFSALALAMNFLCIFPVVGILTLFGFGMRRQKLAYRNVLRKTRTEEPSVPGQKVLEEGTAKAAAERGTAVSAAAASEEGGAASADGISPAEKKLKRTYAYKNRVSWAFAGVSFLLAAFLFMLLASVITYSAYVKVYDDPTDPSLSYLALFTKGFVAPFKLSNITEYTSANAVNVFAWLMPLKASTVYDSVEMLGSSRYLSWNVSMNAAVSVASLVAFSFCTISVIAELFTKNRGARINKRNRRIYLILLAGIVTAMLSSAFVKNTSMLQSSLFGVFYIGFIPLAAKMAQPTELKVDGEGKVKKSADSALFMLIPFLIVFVVFFGLSVPSMYGFEIPARAAQGMFGWMSIFSNGYFRI